MKFCIQLPIGNDYIFSSQTNVSKRLEGTQPGDLSTNCFEGKLLWRDWQRSNRLQFLCDLSFAILYFETKCQLQITSLWWASVSSERRACPKSGAGSGSNWRPTVEFDTLLVGEVILMCFYDNCIRQCLKCVLAEYELASFSGRIV